MTLLFNSVQVRQRPQVERFDADRGRSLEAIFQLVLGELLELPACGDDRRRAVVAGEIYFAIAGERGGGKIGGEALVPDFLAGLGVGAGGDAAVVNVVDQ